ncbi:MAG: hypothetical protein BGO49_11110 [Planctomycetales bacterium 71-10]|nr:MAG: hypothetical protein BGO49_11110 [Planctomycetales bacterium 71-10]
MRSCTGIPPAGTVVEIYTNSTRSVLVQAGVTDAAGEYRFPSFSGNRYAWVPSPHARLAGTGAIVFGNLFSFSDAVATVTLAPASGYACFGGPNCWLPVPTTLHATVDLIGAVTATYIGTGWQADWTPWHYPGCGLEIAGCAPGDDLAPVRLLFGPLALTWTFKGSSNGCPPTEGPTPYSTLPFNPVSISCPPAFSVVYRFTPVVSPNLGYATSCGSDLYATLTE